MRILDLVASAYTVLPQAHSDRSSLATAHRIRIMNFIEAHLGDPDLTPMRVAQACKMTPRYLHHLFSHESETVARYILRRRLEECSRALTVPSQRGRTVTAIAFDYGFNSPTHFGRVFRARYGVTPREYRRPGSQPTHPENAPPSSVQDSVMNFVTRQASRPSMPSSEPCPLSFMPPNGDSGTEI